MALPGFNTKSSVPTILNKQIEEIVRYLNTQAGTKYKYNGKNTVKYISARLNEGYTIKDFKYVIDVKVAEWKGTNMEMYIRPQTLFGNKMENYLNQPMPRKNRASYQVENDYKHDTTNRRI